MELNNGWCVMMAGEGCGTVLCVRERKREHIYILIQLCRVPNNIEAHSLLLYEQKH